MSQNYIANPPLAVTGEPPKPDQFAPYQDDQGNLWTAIIIAVLEHSPDRKFFNVKAVKVIEGDVLVGEWVYEVATAHVLYDPPGPPWP
jgi:hypothetical protein